MKKYTILCTVVLSFQTLLLMAYNSIEWNSIRMPNFLNTFDTSKIDITTATAAGIGGGALALYGLYAWLFWQPTTWTLNTIHKEAQTLIQQAYPNSTIIWAKQPKLDTQESLLRSNTDVHIIVKYEKNNNTFTIDDTYILDSKGSSQLIVTVFPVKPNEKPFDLTKTYRNYFNLTSLNTWFNGGR